MKQPIYFTHGNGFPSPCYRKFFSYLASSLDINYLDKVGHHPDYPVTDNWDFLVQELIQNIEQQYSQPIVGIGHSLGGVLHFMASRQRPELYKAVIMLDSPILSRTKSIAVRLMKWVGVIDKITPAERTKNRKQSWPNAHEAITYLRERPLFAKFDEECLHDYVKYGMEHDANGVHLRFNREIEYHIYRTMPHNLSRYQHRRVVPTGLLYGNSTNIVQPTDLKYMQSHLQIVAKCTGGGHLFPFEHPAQAAQDLMILVQQLLESVNNPKKEQ